VLSALKKNHRYVLTCFQQLKNSSLCSYVLSALKKNPSLCSYVLSALKKNHPYVLRCFQQLRKTNVFYFLNTKIGVVS